MRIVWLGLGVSLVCLFGWVVGWLYSWVGEWVIWVWGFDVLFLGV
jgi:hypothetical protein